MAYKILVLKGDGIGPEVVGEALQVLKIIARRSAVDLEFKEGMIGGHALDTSGTPLPDEVLKHAQDSDAILLGAVGGPKWDNPNAEKRPEQALLGLRKALGLFANIRPGQNRQGTDRGVAAEGRSDHRRRRGGHPRADRRHLLRQAERKARVRKTAARRSIPASTPKPKLRACCKFGFELARERRKKLTSVDKANVLATSRLWREIATELSAQFKDVAFENQLVDSMAMHLIRRPKDFDVVVTENMFGDILTDEASVLAGSMGLLPSASLGEELNSAGFRVGLYEPIHGSAPDIAGRDEANPLAAILSAAMLLEHSLGMRSRSRVDSQAVESVVRDGYRTRDLHGGTGTQTVGCKAMGRLVREQTRER